MRHAHPLLASVLALCATVSGGACTSEMAGLDQSFASTGAMSWPEKVDAFMDRDYLQDELASLLPPRSSVIAARVTRDSGGIAGYTYYEARGSRREAGTSFEHDFSPASSVKLLAAIGAYEVAEAHDLDVNAIAPLYVWESPGPAVPTIAERAFNSITYLDEANRANGDFDRLVEFASPDFFHEEFFTEERGLTPGFLQQRYQYDPNLPTLLDPTMNLCEGDRCESWRASCRPGDDAVDCPYDYEAVACRGGEVDNCSSLFNLAEGIRRTVLDDELAVSDRWRMSKLRRSELKDFIAAPRYQYSEDGARLARAETPIVYHKYGENASSCVDAVLVHYPGSDDRFLYAIEANISASQCRSFLTTMAQAIIEGLSRAPGGPLLRPDFGTFWSASVSSVSNSESVLAQLMVPGATRAELEIDGLVTPLQAGRRGRFESELMIPEISELATLRAYQGSKLVAERLVRIER